MATVTVTYFVPAKYEGFGVIGQVTNTEAITSSGTSQQSTNAASSAKELVRVASAGGDVHILVGDNPTADTDDLLLVDGSVEYFWCSEGDEVAVIDAS